LEAVTEAVGADLKPVLNGKTVELRGEIVLYNGVPEVIVTSGMQLRVLGQ
jgi:DNA/RNA endonuclease YhcR with UshA esterase domain